MAEISLSDESLPKAMSVDIRTAMGTARARIQAKFKKIYSRISENSSPFPRNLSRLLSKKFVNRTNKRIRRDIKNG
jgi:hypothetical protein